MTKAEMRVELKRRGAMALLAALAAPDPVKAANRGSRMLRRLSTAGRGKVRGFRWRKEYK